MITPSLRSMALGALALGLGLTVTGDAAAQRHRPHGHVDAVSVYVAVPGFPRLEKAVQSAFAAQTGRRIALVYDPRYADLVARVRLEAGEPYFERLGRRRVRFRRNCYYSDVKGILPFAYRTAVKYPGRGGAVLVRDYEKGAIYDVFRQCEGRGCRQRFDVAPARSLYGKLAYEIAGDLAHQVRVAPVPAKRFGAKSFRPHRPARDGFSLHGGKFKDGFAFRFAK